MRGLFQGGSLCLCVSMRAMLCECKIGCWSEGALVPEQGICWPAQGVRCDCGQAATAEVEGQTCVLAASGGRKQFRGCWEAYSAGAWGACTGGR